MDRNLPSLNALRVFEAAGRLGGFTGAARELHVTQGAVSRQVKALEEELGIRLFNRLHRRVELTEAGRTLLPQVTEALDGLARGINRLTAPGNELKIKVQASYAVLWLIPHLHRFQEARPDVQVRLTTSNTNVDFNREDFQAGISYGVPPGRNLVSRKIHQERLVAVCSPALARGGPDRGPLRLPADLAAHRLLHNTADKREWRAWMAFAGLAGENWSRGQVFETDHSSLRAAAAGFGVALGDLLLIDDDLKSGRLVRPFDLPPLETGAYYFVHPRAAEDNPALVTFRDWLACLALGDGK